jgi:hypothetical protein
MRRILQTVYFNFGVCLQQAEIVFLRHYYSRQVILFPGAFVIKLIHHYGMENVPNSPAELYRISPNIVCLVIKLSIRKDELCFFLIILFHFCLHFKIQTAGASSKFSFRKAPLLL